MIPVIIMITCVVCLAACNDEEDPFDEAVDRARLSKMEAEIDDLIGDATCKDTKDCRSIAFGDKPCGGPWSYKIYSVADLDTLQLAGLVAAHKKFNGVLNMRYGWVSDCRFVMPPDIDCVEGRCAAVAKGVVETVE